MSESLLSPTFLYRFSVPCRRHDLRWSDKGIELPEHCRLLPLAELAGERTFADVRAAWSEDGLAMSVRVAGKRQSPWCRETRLDDSDGLTVWIDTRDTHTIHRASRFCHRFVFLPAGGGRKLDEPVADQALVNRARENARPIRPGQLKVHAERRVDGYHLSALIPADAMTGFQTSDHPRLGFTYAVFDRELGVQTFTVGTEFPFDADPSLWATLELAE